MIRESRDFLKLNTSAFFRDLLLRCWFEDICVLLEDSILASTSLAMNRIVELANEQHGLSRVNESRVGNSSPYMLIQVVMDHLGSEEKFCVAAVVSELTPEDCATAIQRVVAIGNDVLSECKERYWLLAEENGAELLRNANCSEAIIWLAFVEYKKKRADRAHLDSVIGGYYLGNLSFEDALDRFKSLLFGQGARFNDTSELFAVQHGANFAELDDSAKRLLAAVRQGGELISPEVLEAFGRYVLRQ